MRSLSTCIGLFLLGSPAWAVLQSWEGGTGGLAAPQLEQALEVVRTQIRLDGVGLDQMRQGERWNTEVQMRLRAEKAAPLSVVVPYQLRVEGMSLNPISQEGEPQVGEPLARGFSISWQGDSLPNTTGSVKPTWGLPDRGFTFGWIAEFSPQGEGDLVYRFQTGVTTHESGARWARLAMGTAALWKSFRQVAIEVRPGVPSRSCRDLMRTDPDLYTYLVGTENSPAGVKQLGDGASSYYRWELDNLTGQEDLNFCFISAQAHRRNLVRQLILQRSAFFQGQEKVALKRLRNLVYATYGLKFKNKKEAAHFRDQWWYASDPGFRFARLSEGEKDLVRYLAKMERFAEK